MTELLAPAARESISAMLRDAGMAHVVRDVELLLDRQNILRVHTTQGSVVVKRAHQLHDGTVDRGSLQREAAALALFRPMPELIAPRLIGFDALLDLVVMEDLPPGRTLSELFLFGDEAAAASGLSKLASALASMHSFTGSRIVEYRAAMSGLDAPRLRRVWLERARGERRAFLEALAPLVPVDGVDGEITWVLDRLATTPIQGLFHGDLCPDNVRLTASGVRIFDFEASDFGPLALDAAYLLAPFPSCWCFAELPITIERDAFAVYLDQLSLPHDEDEFSIDVGAALACFLVAWLGQLPNVLSEDDLWGTTTMRPRILRWLGSFERHESVSATMPRLLELARGVSSHLLDRWPDVGTPRYPAFAGSDEAVAVPSFWQPGL